MDNIIKINQELFQAGFYKNHHNNIIEKKICDEN